jgi:hypothetical protein
MPRCKQSVRMLQSKRDGIRASSREKMRLKHTFFMIPALRFEKVMCRRDLSVMNLISIFLRSRPGLSSSSSSSSAVEGRWRLTPRLSIELPLPTACSSRADGEPWSCWSVMSAIVIRSLRYDENDSFEIRADDLTAYGEWRLLSCFVADTWSRTTGLRLA